MRLIPAICLALLLAVPAAALAKKNDQHRELRLEPGAFAEQKQSIENELAGGDLYREIGEEERGQVLSTLQRMANLLQDKPSIDGLPDELRVKLFNDQELVNRILTQAAKDSQLSCRKEHRTGSRVPTVICKTVAQRRMETETSQYNYQHGNYTPRTTGAPEGP